MEKLLSRMLSVLNYEELEEVSSLIYDLQKARFTAEVLPKLPPLSEEEFKLLWEGNAVEATVMYRRRLLDARVPASRTSLRSCKGKMDAVQEWRKSCVGPSGWPEYLAYENNGLTPTQRLSA